MLAYTGFYQGVRVTVMGHGMGIPSIGIYSYELFSPDLYDVQNIIRIGSCGSYVKHLNVNDLIVATSAYSESNYPKLIGLEQDGPVNFPTPELVTLSENTAKSMGLKLYQTRCHSSDAFYGVATPDQVFAQTGSEVVEMEAFALYANAQKLGKKALCLLTVSDSLITHEALNAEQRRIGFKKMVQLALEMTVQLD